MVTWYLLKFSQLLVCVVSNYPTHPFYNVTNIVPNTCKKNFNHDNCVLDDSVLVWSKLKAFVDNKLTQIRAPDRGSGFYFTIQNINYSPLNPKFGGTHKNRLIKTIVMSAHNIGFGREIMDVEYNHSL